MSEFADRTVLSTQKWGRRDFLNRALTAAGGALVVGPSFLQGCAKTKLSTVSRPCRPKYNTIAHEMLDIELEHNQNPNNYFALDRIIDSARERIRFAEDSDDEQDLDPVQTLKIIDHLLKDMGFQYKRNRLLSTAIEHKEIDCDCYSAIYLAIGEELDLPIKMVRAPGHTFVRWHFSKRRYLNWETTIGENKNDQYYIEQHNIAKEVRGISSLRSLDVHDNREEILANAFLSSGAEWLGKCRTKEAIIRFGQAVHMDPLYETPYYNLGLAYYHVGQIESSIKWCELALKLNPNHLKSNALLTSAYIQKGDEPSSFKHYSKVIELDPDYYSEEAILDRRQTKGLCG